MFNGNDKIELILTTTHTATTTNGNGMRACESKSQVRKKQTVSLSKIEKPCDMQ